MPKKKKIKKKKVSGSGTSSGKKTKKRGRVENLKPWPKGKSGNPRGPRKLPDEVKEFRKMDRNVLSRMIMKWAQKSMEELKAVKKASGTTALDRYIVSLFINGEKTGSPVTFDTIMNRAVGKVPNEEIVTSNEMELGDISDEGLKKIHDILKKERKGDRS